MIKLTNVLNEAGNQWTVKDIIVMQKAHERVLKATGALQKAVNNLYKISNKNANKPNGKIFASEANDMSRNFERVVTNPSGKFWKNWEEYRKGGEAAFPDHWKTNR
jgi:hypothetical protein